MALTDRIAALTTAIATAFNARVQAPATGYDVAVLNGYTGTQAQWLADFSDPGNTNYASQFNSQLGSIPTAGVASETQVGTTQLASAAEMFAGTSSTKAISVLRHANIHIASSFSDLNTKAASLAVGSIIALPTIDLSASSAGVIYRSIWYSNGPGQPMQPLLPILVSTVSTLTWLNNNIGASKTYTNLGFDGGVSYAIVSRTSTPQASNTNIRDEYMWLGATAGWVLWRGYAGNVTFASGVSIRDGNTNFQNQVLVDGEEAHLVFNTTTANAIAQYGLILTIPAIATPNLDVFITSAYTGGASTWVTGSCYVQTDGTVRPLTWAPPANTVISGTGNWKRKVGI